MLGFAPCMPFLLCWPGVASLMLEHNGPEREFGVFMAAYLIGTIGYAVAAGLIMAAAIDQFDEKSGRIQGGSNNSPRLPGPS